MSESLRPWYRELNSYHWFVLAVCTLGWLFDCFDQQLFANARKPAVTDLLQAAPGDPKVEMYTTMATSFLLIGWATGGIFFGIMGDRVGRAKTMVWTILAYSVFTGLSGFAFTVWDFILYRFMTGLGVGGQFAVGVSLVAEVMPDRARTPALGMLQALSAVGNVAAALIAMGFNYLEGTGQLPAAAPSAWRWMFAVGILPALLSIVVISRLEEPERWKKAVAEGAGKKKAGSLREIFGDPRWRRRVIVGMVLASAGVVGLWGIGFFMIDLNRSVFRKISEEEARQQNEAEKDRQFVCLALGSAAAIDEAKAKLAPQKLLTLTATDNDAQEIFAAAVRLRSEGRAVSPETVLAALDQPASGRPEQSSADRQRRIEYLKPPSQPSQGVAEHIERISVRDKRIGQEAGWWSAITSMLFNIGAFFGIYVFSRVTQRIGRRPAFAIFFLAAMASTIMAFLFMDSAADVFWMVPLTGFCQLSVFGGYAIYFPELFPTHLRSTGTSLCYNIARFAAATGPLGLGLLTSKVFAGFAEPLRYAGATMSAVFLIGILVLPFAPETRDEPLPE
jgi:MFS family permease